jgi:hypothetical protein
MVISNRIFSLRDTSAPDQRLQRRISDFAHEKDCDQSRLRGAGRAQLRRGLGRRRFWPLASMCNDPASGGRMIDNIITNTLLPAPRGKSSSVRLPRNLEGNQGDDRERRLRLCLGVTQA